MYSLLTFFLSILYIVSLKYAQVFVIIFFIQIIDFMFIWHHDSLLASTKARSQSDLFCLFLQLGSLAMVGLALRLVKNLWAKPSESLLEGKWRAKSSCLGGPGHSPSVSDHCATRLAP